MKARKVYPCILTLLLFICTKGYTQHPVLEISAKKIAAIRDTSHGYWNNASYFLACTQHIFYLSHFRDSGTVQFVNYFNSTTAKSSLPVARAYWLYGQAHYLYFIKKNYKQALANNLEAIGIFEKENYNKEVAYCHARASAVLMWQSAQENWATPSTLADGINHALTSTRIGKQLHDTDIICTGLMYAGNHYIAMHKTDSAKQVLHEAGNLALKTQLTYPVDNNVWGTLAELYTFSGNTDSALLYADKCLETGLAQNDFYSISSIWQLKGELLTAYGKTRNYPQGIGHLETSYKYAAALKDISVMARVEHSLFSAYKAAGNEKKALYYLEQVTKHNEALRRQNEISIKADYELSQREKQIGFLKNEKLVSNTKKQKLLIGVLSLTALLIALAAIFFARNNYMLRQRKKEIEEALKKGQNIERKRMAADLHDNLGVQASAILHSTSVLKDSPEESREIVENLHDTAKEMIVNLRETLWAMKNTDVTAAELWIRVIHFSKQLGNHYKHIQVAVNGTAPKDVILDSPRALHILMIVQESANNAAKHAVAKQITFRSEVLPGLWQIYIKDDGKGFIKEDAGQNKDSYGLQHMHERACAANAAIQVQSEQGKGTEVRIQIKFTGTTHLEH